MPELAVKPENRSAPMSDHNSTVLNELLGHRDAAYLLAFRITASSADAEDAVQEGYLRAIRFQGQIRSGPESRAWLLRIVANAARDLRSSRKSRQIGEVRFAMDATKRNAGQSAGAEAQKLRDAVADALAALDEDLRLPVSLHYEQGLSYADAAKVLAMPEGTLRVYASRGLQALRERLARSGHSVTPIVLAATLAGGLGIKSPELLTATIKTILIRGANPAEKTASAASAKLAAIKIAAALLIVAAAAFHFSHRSPQTNPKIGAPLAGVLAQRLTITYRRDFLWEVTNDLQERGVTGIVYPKSLERSFLFSLEGEFTVQEVLEKLARAGGLNLDYRGDRVLLRKGVDDSAFAGLVNHPRDNAGEKEPIELLLAQSRHDDADIRKEAANRLRLTRDPRGIERLVEMLEDANPLVAGRASVALGTSRNSRAAQPLFDFLSRAAANSALGFPWDQTAWCAAWSVGHLRDSNLPEALAPLLEAPDIHVRECVIAALGETRDPHALDLLLPLLKDLDTTVRRAAAKAAILTFDPRAVEPVLALTYSNDVDEQTSVCVALREQSSDPRVHARFVELSKDPHAQLRSAIGSILNAASDRQDISDF